MRGGNERGGCWFCLPAGCAGGEDDASALPSSFPDRGETRTACGGTKAEQKEAQKMPTSTAGSAGGGRKMKWGGGVEKLPVLLSSVVFGGTPLSL